MATRLSRYEMETVITFNAEEKTANIYSTDPVWIRKIKELGGERDSIGWVIDVPKSWIKIRRPLKLSEAEKERRRELLRKTRQKSFSPVDSRTKKA